MIKRILDCFHGRLPFVKTPTKEERWQLSDGPAKDDFEAINNARFTKAAAVSNAVATTLTGATAIIATVNAKQPSPKVMINGQAYEVEGGSAPGSTLTSAAVGLGSAAFAMVSVYYGMKLAYPPHPLKVLRDARADGYGPGLAIEYRHTSSGKKLFAMPGDPAPLNSQPLYPPPAGAANPPPAGAQNQPQAGAENELQALELGDVAPQNV